MPLFSFGVQRDAEGGGQHTTEPAPAVAVCPGRGVLADSGRVLHDVGAIEGRRAGLANVGAVHRSRPQGGPAVAECPANAGWVLLIVKV